MMILFDTRKLNKPVKKDWKFLKAYGIIVCVWQRRFWVSYWHLHASITNGSWFPLLIEIKTYFSGFKRCLGGLSWRFNVWKLISINFLHLYSSYCFNFGWSWVWVKSINLRDLLIFNFFRMILHPNDSLL